GIALPTADPSLDAPAPRRAGAPGSSPVGERVAHQRGVTAPARFDPALRAGARPEHDVPREGECGLRLLAAPATDEDREATAPCGGVADPPPVSARLAHG